MIDFKNKIVKVKKQHKTGYSIGIVRYNNNVFTISVGDKEYPVDAYKFADTKVVYSKPNNDKYKNWTKRRISSINVNNYKFVKQYWAIIKLKQKVRGIVKDNTFIIKKY